MQQHLPKSSHARPPSYLNQTIQGGKPAEKEDVLISKISRILFRLAGTGNRLVVRYDHDLVHDCGLKAPDSCVPPGAARQWHLAPSSHEGMELG